MDRFVPAAPVEARHKLTFMATELHAATWIAASPDQVWQILADLASYPQWNPFVVSATGELFEGERLHVRLHPPGARPVTVRPTLSSVVPGQELRWNGSLGPRGLFDGEHTFRLQPLGRGTHFVQHERFTGALVPLLLPRLSDRLQQGFEEMNAALRTRAERAAAHDPPEQPADRDLAQQTGARDLAELADAHGVTDHAGVSEAGASELTEPPEHT